MTPDTRMLQDLHLTHEQWFRAVAAVRVNIWNDADELSVTLNVFGSFFNHSCAPNAYLNDTPGKPNRAVLIREVKQGDEVTFSYSSSGLLLRPASQRQDMLRVRWGFVCACQRCKIRCAAEEEAQMITSVDKTKCDETLDILNGKGRSMTGAESLKIQHMVQVLRNRAALDWRAHAIRKRLLEVRMVDSVLKPLIASHYLKWLAACTEMHLKFLPPASEYKNQAYDTAMQIGPHYGIARNKIFATMVKADPWFGSLQFARMYQPEVSPSLFVRDP